MLLMRRPAHPFRAADNSALLAASVLPPRLAMGHEVVHEARTHRCSRCSGGRLGFWQGWLR